MCLSAEPKKRTIYSTTNSANYFGEDMPIFRCGNHQPTAAGDRAVRRVSFAARKMGISSQSLMLISTIGTVEYTGFLGIFGRFFVDYIKTHDEKDLVYQRVFTFLETPFLDILLNYSHRQLHHHRKLTVPCCFLDGFCHRQYSGVQK